MCHQNRSIMKRFLLIGLLALLIMPLFGQDIPPTPGSPWEALGQFSYLIGSFGGAIALLFFFVPFVLGALNVTGKFLKYLVTVVCVAVVVVAAYFLKFGFLYNSHWWTIPVNVGLISLIQVGMFSWEFIKNIQDKIYEKWNPWKNTG